MVQTAQVSPHTAPPMYPKTKQEQLACEGSRRERKCGGRLLSALWALGVMSEAVLPRQPLSGDAADFHALPESPSSVTLWARDLSESVNGPMVAVGEEGKD